MRSLKYGNFGKSRNRVWRQLSCFFRERTPTTFVPLRQAGYGERAWHNEDRAGAVQGTIITELHVEFIRLTLSNYWIYVVKIVTWAILPPLKEGLLFRKEKKSVKFTNILMWITWQLNVSHLVFWHSSLCLAIVLSPSIPSCPCIFVRFPWVEIIKAYLFLP